MKIDGLDIQTSPAKIEGRKVPARGIVVPCLVTHLSYSGDVQGFTSAQPA